MNVFNNYHPIVTFLYFGSAIFFSVKCTHPIYLGISAFSLILYTLLQNRAVYLWCGILLIITPPVYFLTSHGGVSVITYLPDGNPLTRESVIYGIVAGIVLSNTLLWTVHSLKIMTSERLMCITGKLHPVLSLVISMVFRFVPAFVNQFKKTAITHRGMGINTKKPASFKRIFSITLTWAMENAIETSNSMKARGYGVSKRTSFDLFKFKKSDLVMCVLILILILCIFWGIITDKNSFLCMPCISINTDTPLLFVAYFIFLIIPSFVELNKNLSRS